jgi:hypothetical protein
VEASGTTSGVGRDATWFRNMTQPPPSNPKDDVGAEDDLLGWTLRLPDHVVYRSFIAETVLLNLETGRYHGLNPIAGYMLTVVTATPTVREAAEQISAQYDRDEAEVEKDLVALARDLLQRGLVEREEEGSAA